MTWVSAKLTFLHDQQLYLCHPTCGPCTQSSFLIYRAHVSQVQQPMENTCCDVKNVSLDDVLDKYGEAVCFVSLHRTLSA